MGIMLIIIMVLEKLIICIIKMEILILIVGQIFKDKIN